MLWQCSCCGAKDNKGQDRRCANCGWPKGEKDREYMPADISRASALQGDADKDARSGPDWQCTYCQAHVRARAKSCTQCGADKATGKQRWEAIKKTMPTTTTVAPQSKKPLRRILPWGWLVGSALIFSFLLYLFMPSEYPAKAVRCTWVHKVQVQRLQLVADEGWMPPAEAVDAHQNGARLHHYNHVLSGYHQEAYQERYACGQNCTTIPGSCTTTPVTCRPNGNGTATCSGGEQTCSPARQSCSTKYCDKTAYRQVPDYIEVPEYRSWWVWKEWVWLNNRNVIKEGVGTKEMVWPSQKELLCQNCTGQERYHRIARYSVVFKNIADSNKAWTLIPETQAMYRAWCAGTWKIRASRASASVIGKLSDG